MLQDREGYLWYATEGGGLCRDDGYRIEVFRSSPQSPGLLASNTVTCLAEDERQRIWFGTDRGLYVLDKSDYQVEAFAPQGQVLCGGRVDALRAMSDGTVWFSSQNQMVHCSPDGDVLGRYVSEWRGRQVPVADFYEDHEGTLWVMQWDGGLLRYDAGADRMQPCAWDCKAFPCQMVEDRRSGCYWVATWGQGVVRYVPGGKNREVLLQYQPSTCSDSGMDHHKSLVLGLLKDTERGLLWVVAMDDLYVYSIMGERLLPVDVSDFLPSGKKILDRPLEDRWKNIWIPGYSPHTFILSPYKQRIRRDEVEVMKRLTGYPVMVDRLVADGKHCWMWQGRTGVALYDLETGDMVMASDMGGELSRLSISKCLEKCAGEEGIWTCSGNRVLRLWHEGGVIRMEEVARVDGGERVSALCDDGKGALWAGAGKTLYRCDGQGGGLKKVFSGQGAVRDIVASPLGGGQVYVLTSQGIVCVEGESGFRKVAEGTDYEVADVAGDGKVYVGGATGNVYVYDPDSRDFRMEENAGNRNGDAIKSIATDGSGHVWVLTDQYVKEYNPANGSFYLLRNSDKEVRMDYFHSVCRVGDSVCIGGIGAFCMVEPSAELDKAAQQVSPVVSAYSVNGERHFVGTGTERVEVPPGRNVLEFSFSTLDHLHARQVSFAYRLKGQEADWTYLPSGTNTVSLARLPAGDYVLEVMATDMHGCWGKPVACLVLRCLPFWHETWWARMLFALCAACGAAAVLRAYFRRAKRKQQELLEQRMTQMKFRFFTNVSHELRTPLTLIITPLEQLLGSVCDEGLQGRLRPIYRHACELLELINHLLDFRKLETDSEKLYLLNGDLPEFVRTTCESFKPLSENRGVAFRCDVAADHFFMYFDPDKIHRVLYNLLGNAFKFTPSGGRVGVSAGLSGDGKTFEIVVEDSGCGISEQDLPRVFERYFQSKNGTAGGGSGIGLYLVKAYVGMHGGRVEVDSREGEGTSFRVALPTDLRPDGASAGLAAAEEASSGGIRGDGKRKSLLVVEDNAELRRFLTGSLSCDYEVHEAASGPEAEEMLREHGAEVVVSDVMMPGMDGFELCRRLKQDVRTSHLFVILLSAYGQDAERLEGYEAGADCYLTKPFNMDILRNRIRHFFDLQDGRKKAFFSAAEFRAADIAPTKVDEEFLKKAADCVERHLGDAAYNVELFSGDMCMSRMNLYRKLQSLTGQTPSEFVRAIRLKKAAQIIASGKGETVSGIADRVGFSTPSYFSKCFREMFGVLPTQYKG